MKIPDPNTSVTLTYDPLARLQNGSTGLVIGFGFIFIAVMLWFMIWQEKKTGIFPPENIWLRQSLLGTAAVFLTTEGIRNFLGLPLIFGDLSFAEFSLLMKTITAFAAIFTAIPLVRYMRDRSRAIKRIQKERDASKND